MEKSSGLTNRINGVLVDVDHIAENGGIDF
jgi:hypothetical protein